MTAFDTLPGIMEGEVFLPLPLTPAGGLDWELVGGQIADLTVAEGGYVKMIVTGCGFTQRFHGFVRGPINITSKQN